MFSGWDILSVLQPMKEMTPKNHSLFVQFAERLSGKDIFPSLTTLNLMGIIRVFTKVDNASDPTIMKFISQKVLPRVTSEVAKFDAVELVDVLASIADHAVRSGAAQDAHLLAIVLPEIEKRYNETSLLHSITNMNSLCKLRVLHPGLLERITKDLNDPLRLRNIPPKYLSRVVWVFARYGRLDQIFSSVIPFVRQK